MSYQSEVLADLPLFYWRLGETSGTVAADTSGNANTGTYTNGPTLGVTSLLASDTSNTAVTFDGVDDSVRSSPFTAVYTTLSVEALIKPTSFANGPFVCGFEDDILNLTVNADGSVLFGSGAATFTTSAGMIEAGSTYHLAATSSGSVAKIYVNGALAATGSAGSVSVSGLGFWAGDDSFSDPFASVIDEVAFYTTELSAARVLAHYNASVSSANLYTPPILNDCGPILFDTRGLPRLLFRHYAARPRFQTVWKLATTPITYSLTQPYPLITPQDVAQGNVPIGQQYNAATYLHVYYGPEEVDAAEAARLVASGIGTVT